MSTEKKFLDNAGLNTVWNLIKNNFFDKTIGLDHPLYFKYKDNKNTDWLFKYNGIEIIYGGYGGSVPGSSTGTELIDNYSSLVSEITENDYNIIDLSSGVYYATTSTTATKVSNELTLKQGDSVISYNGQLKETFDVTPLKEITYSELKTLRDNNELIPGNQYRITDFVTTTNGNEGSVSAKHAFDIIVKALDKNILSENVSVCKAKYVNKDSTIPDTPFNGEWYSHVNVGPTDWVAPETSELVADMAAVLDFEPTTDTIRKVCITEYNSDGDSPWKITCTTGSLCVKFNWVSGSKKINMCGVTLKSVATNQIVSRDYHYGSAGNTNVNNKYVLQVPTDGDYYIDCFVIKQQNYDSGIIDSTVTISAYPINTDDYFNNCKLTSWDVKYSLDNDGSRFRWAKSDGKGVIYYLKDEYNNQAGFDFKNIMFNNKYVFNYRINDVNYDGSVAYGRYCHDNTVGVDLTDVSTGTLMGLSKINFNNTSTSAECHSNVIHKNCWSIQFGNGCNKNVINSGGENTTFGNNCIENILGSDCKRNQFGNDCKYNILNEGCLRNTFGQQCIANVLDNDCNDNTFESQCCDNKLGRLSNNNTFKAGCYSNTFGSNCKNNTFETNTSASPSIVCYSNTFGSNCNSNTFGAGCHSNTFGADCSSNIFGTNCYSNTFGASSSSNNFETNCYSNIFGVNCDSNTFGINCYGIITSDNFYSNTFGSNCTNNEFGYDCDHNQFGEYCYSNNIGDQFKSNNLGNYCHNNTFGNNCKNNVLTSFCYSNNFGNFCWTNKLGNGVYSNTFGIDCSDIQIITAENSTTLLQFVKNFKFGNYCTKLKIYPKVAVTTTDTALGYVQNFEFGNNLGSTAQYTNIALEGTAENLLGRKYITTVDKDSNGTIVQKCLMDIDKNINFSYESGTLTITTVSTN